MGFPHLNANIGLPYETASPKLVGVRAVCRSVQFKRSTSNALDSPHSTMSLASLGTLAGNGVPLQDTGVGCTRLLRGTVALALLLAAPLVRAETLNGNDFALYFTEAAGTPRQQQVLDEALGNPLFFRYLQIMEIEDLSEKGGDGIRIVAFEPSSFMDVKFTVTKAVSLSVIQRDPVSKKGDALALTGRLTRANAEENAIYLESVIVKHKDRLSPARGKELLSEVDPGAVFYSYTEGPRPVNLTAEHRDLLQYRDRILKEKGPAGWVEFLEREVAKRKMEAKKQSPAKP